MILLILSSSGAEAEASEFLPPTMAHRAGPAPPPSTSVVPAEDCPLIQVPSLIDACRSPPGLRACAAQCVVYHYRGGHCEVLPNGRLGDCTCMNCLGSQA
uniref:Knottin scorpion toxin-like domain-containing protein n=1 Tax=Arundo donax TaxID=35708 RepID=A0A0A8XYT7_ARUDO